MSAAEMQERTLRPDDAPDVADLTDSPWAVTDHASAMWAVRKVRDARQAADAACEPIRALIAEHEAEIAALRQAEEAHMKRAAGPVEFFTARLAAWHRTLLAADPKGPKSINLGIGTLKSRAGTDRVTVDPDAVDDLVEAGVAMDAPWATYTPKVDKRKLMAWVKETGELPVGVEMVRATEDDRRWEVSV